MSKPSLKPSPEPSAPVRYHWYLRTWFLLLFLLGLIWGGLYLEAQDRTAKWNYRISLTIETPEGLKTAEVVRTQQVTFPGGPLQPLMMMHLGSLQHRPVGRNPCS